MEYLGPVDSSSLPVRLRWKLCRAVLRPPPPPPPSPEGFVVCFASQETEKIFFFLPPLFLVLLLSPSSRPQKRWCSHAHQRPGWRYFQQPSPQPAAELLPPPLAATVIAGWPGATTVRGTQVLARTAQARATIAGTFSAAEREAATKPRPFPLCGWREGGEEGKLLPKVMPCAPQMCTGNFLGTVTR